MKIVLGLVVMSLSLSVFAQMDEIESLMVSRKSNCAKNLEGLSKPGIGDTLANMHPENPAGVCGDWTGKRMDFSIKCDKNGGLTLSAKGYDFSGFKMCKLTKKDLSKVGLGYYNVKNDVFGYAKYGSYKILVRIRIGAKGIKVTGVSRLAKSYLEGIYRQKSTQFAKPMPVPDRMIASEGVVERAGERGDDSLYNFSEGSAAGQQ